MSSEIESAMRRLNCCHTFSRNLFSSHCSKNRFYFCFYQRYCWTPFDSTTWECHFHPNENRQSWECQEKNLGSFSGQFCCFLRTFSLCCHTALLSKDRRSNCKNPRSRWNWKKFLQFRPWKSFMSVPKRQHFSFCSAIFWSSKSGDRFHLLYPLTWWFCFVW